MADTSTADGVVASGATAMGGAPAWTEHISPDGRPYYYNAFTETSQWEAPPEYTPAAPVEMGAPVSVDTGAEAVVVSAAGTGATGAPVVVAADAGGQAMPGAVVGSGGHLAMAMPGAAAPLTDPAAAAAAYYAHQMISAGIFPAAGYGSPMLSPAGVPPAAAAAAAYGGMLPGAPMFAAAPGGYDAYGGMHPGAVIGPGPPIQKHKNAQGPPGCNLFVFHIPNNMTNAQLYTLFSPYGEVISARIMVERETGRSRGYGFVSFAHPDFANRAIQSLDGFTIGRKRLSVSHKRPKGTGGPPRGRGQGNRRRRAPPGPDMPYDAILGSVGAEAYRGLAPAADASAAGAPATVAAAPGVMGDTAAAAVSAGGFATPGAPVYHAVISGGVAPVVAGTAVAGVDQAMAAAYLQPQAAVPGAPVGTSGAGAFGAGPTLAAIAAPGPVGAEGARASEAGAIDAAATSAAAANGEASSDARPSGSA